MGTQGTRPVAEPRRVVVIAYPQAKLLDVTGPCEVFADANRALGPDAGGYSVELVSAGAGRFETSCGVQLVAHRGYAAVRGAIDTLLVSGGPGVAQAAEDAALLRWLRHLRSARRGQDQCEEPRCKRGERANLLERLAGHDWRLH